MPEVVVVFCCFFVLEAVEMMSCLAVDWSELPPELLQFIASRLETIADYVRFRAVCRGWCAAAPIDRRLLPREFPWLMLPAPSSRRRFFNPLVNRLHRIVLPEISRCHRCAGSSFGWLILMDESPSIFILNPLTGDKIDLPPLSSFPDVISLDYYSVGREYTVRAPPPGNNPYSLNLRQMRDSFIRKMILSHNPFDRRRFLAVGILNRHETLAYCTPGDTSWRIIDEIQGYSEDLICFKEKLYAVNKSGSLAVHNPNSNATEFFDVNAADLQDGDELYLVNAMGEELLLISRYLDFEIDVVQYHEVCSTFKFVVHRLDWSSLKWEKMENLNDRIIFLGTNSSLAIKASDYSGCKGNMIYFTDDYSSMNNQLGGNYDVGIYNVGDGTIESLPFYPRTSQWPIWITPTLC